MVESGEYKGDWGVQRLLWRKNVGWSRGSQATRNAASPVLPTCAHKSLEYYSTAAFKSTTKKYNRANTPV